MWFVYILYSISIDKYYVGFTENLETRISRHNAGWGNFTEKGIPWELVHSEKFENKSVFNLTKLYAPNMISDILNQAMKKFCDGLGLVNMKV